MFHDSKELAAHFHKEHELERAELNSEIICWHLPTVEEDKWADAMPFLHVRLTINPPPFRPNEFLDLNLASSDTTTNAKSHFIDIFLDLTLKYNSKELAPDYEQNEALLLYIDILILGLKPTDYKGSLTTLVR